MIIATLKNKMSLNNLKTVWIVRWVSKELIDNINTHYILLEQLDDEKVFILLVTGVL